MASMREFFDALELTVREATRLRGHAWVADDFEPPAFIVNLSDTLERSTMQLGQMEIPFQIVVFTPKADDRTGQFSLMDYVDFNGDKSVWQALDRKPHLGLDDTDAKVLRYRPLGIEEVAAYGYYGGAFEGLAITKGAE